LPYIYKPLDTSPSNVRHAQTGERLVVRAAMATTFKVMATMMIKAWNLVVKNSDKRMIVKLSAEELERDDREIADGEGDAAPFIHGYAAANGPVRTAHAPPECWDP
jgi:hypothetical protein